MMVPVGMKDSHQLFLQSFMAKGLLEKEEVLTLHNYARQRFPGIHTFQCTVHPIVFSFCHSMSLLLS